MILTEAEASFKRCTPALILLVMEAQRFYSLAARSEKISTSCIGSACMQWCWFDYANAEGVTYRDEVGFSKGRKEPSYRTDGSSLFKKLPARGYCGLTGSRE